MFEEGAALSRRPEIVDEFGPPTDFIDIDILPLKETEVTRTAAYTEHRRNNKPKQPSPAQVR